MLIAAVFCLFLFRYGYFQPLVGGDTQDYLLAADRFSFSALLHGEVDTLRLPGYPALIYLSRGFFGHDNACRVVVIVQYLLYFLSIPCFCRIVEHYKLGVLCTWFAIVCYSVTPTLIAWNQMILPESLSISATVFFIFLVFIYLERPTYLKAALLGMSAFFLVMLRPSFLFLVPMLFLFWILVTCVFFKGIRKHLAGFGCTVLSLAMILGYCHLIEKKCGVFNLTEVAVSNQFQIIIQSGLYKKGKDRDLMAKIQDAIDRHERKNDDISPGNEWVYPDGLSDETFRSCFWRIRPNDMPLSQRSAFVRQILRDHRWEYIQYSLGKFLGVRHEVVGGRLSPKVITFGLIYFLLACEAVTIALSTVRRRGPTLLCAMIWLLIAGVVFTTVVGAQHTTMFELPSEYSRLVVSAIPFVIILIFRYLDVLLCYWRMIARKTPSCDNATSGEKEDHVRITT